MLPAVEVAEVINETKILLEVIIMIKKLAYLGIAFLMLFSLVACNGIGLEKYKTDAKVELEQYATDKGQDNYTDENWDVILNIVANCKSKIDVATNKVEVDTVLASAKKEIDGVEKIGEETTDQIQNGAYFATGISNSFALVKGNLITFNEVFTASSFCADYIISDTFEFALADREYTGSNARKTISFMLLNNELTVNIALHGGTATKTKLLRDATVTLSSEGPVQLSPPQDVEINPMDLRWYPTEFMYQWEPSAILMNKAGILGFGFDIKPAGKQDFELTGIIDYYSEPDCFFYLYFPDLNLLQGTNIVRVYCVGGLFLQDGKVRESISSEPVYFSVTVNAQGEVITQKI